MGAHGGGFSGRFSAAGGDEECNTFSDSRFSRLVLLPPGTCLPFWGAGHHFPFAVTNVLEVWELPFFSPSAPPVLELYHRYRGTCRRQPTLAAPKQQAPTVGHPAQKGVH